MALPSRIALSAKRLPVDEEEEEEIYIFSSRLGLIKMDHHHSGNGRTVSNEPCNRK
jgi:hypothetical protein